MILSEKFFESKTKVILALLLPAVLLYYKSVRYDFSTLDEQWLIVQNADLLGGFKAVTQGFTKSITGLYYRPMLIASVFIDYKIGRLSPSVYHLSNLLMHLSCILLLFKFLRLNKVSKQAAFVSALVFSVHPILLHAVVWVPGRNDLILCLFSLSSLIFLLLFFTRPKKIFLLFHFLFFICAFLTKETAVALPLIFVANYLVYKKMDLKQFLSLLFGWAAVAFAWLSVRNSIVEVPAPDTLGLWEVVKNFVPAMILYTGKALFSMQQSILPLLRHASLIPGLAAVLLLILLVFKPGIKDKKIASLGLLLFFLILALPVWFSASKNGAEHYEHRIYTAMAGMVLFFTQIKFNYNSRIFQGCVIFVVIVFCFKTYTRMNIYKSKESFVNAGIKECPDNYLFLASKSMILFNQNNFQEALDFSSRAIALRPDKAQLYSNRASANYKLGFYQNAVADYSNAIKLSPRMDYVQYLSRALAFEKCNDMGKAMKDLIFLDKCCQAMVPADIRNLINSRWDRTLQTLREQIAEQPGNAKLFYQRAMLYFDVDMEKEGLADLSEACRLDPLNKEYLSVYMTHYEK